MSTRPLSRAAVRDIDVRALRDYGLPGIVLMENAGRGAAEFLLNCGIAGRVVVCAGKGNNGGDGFVIARHLDLHRIDVRVLLFCDPADLPGDAAINYRVVQNAGLKCVVFGTSPEPRQLETELDAAEWIVDALLGTGTVGSIREPYASVIAAINRAGKKVFAVDIPSGMDCDTGQPLGECIRATQTATFVAPKIGFAAPGASVWTGVVQVVDIGVPRRLLEQVFGVANASAQDHEHRR